MGLFLLLAGEKFFWVFTGAIGAVLGVQYLGPLWATPLHGWLGTVIGGIIGGVFGILLAIVAQGLAIILGGFIAGGKILTFLAQTVITISPDATLTFFVVGGIIAAVFLMMFLKETLIVITSLWGASLIVSQQLLTFSNNLFFFIALTLIGIVVQSISYRRRKLNAT